MAGTGATAGAGTRSLTRCQRGVEEGHRPQPREGEARGIAGRSPPAVAALVSAAKPFRNEAIAEVRDVLKSIGDTCPNARPNPTSGYLAGLAVRTACEAGVRRTEQPEFC